MSVLSMSIAGSVLILVVVVLRALLLEKLPKTTFTLLWGLVLLRLLIPFEIPSKVSIYNLFPADTVHSIVKPTTDFSMLIPGTEKAVQAIGRTPQMISPAMLIWLGGALFTLLVFGIVYFRALRELKTALPCEQPLVTLWLENIDMKRTIKVRTLDKIKTPLTYGILRPVILLPKSMDFSQEDKLLAILTHEYIHIRRFDSIKKLLLVAAVSVHWFNPLVWVMYVLFNRDLELVCDEKVLQELGADKKADYALTLVEMSEPMSKFTLNNGFSKNALEERIKALMKHKKATVLSIVVVIALLVGVTIFFATSRQHPNVDNERSVMNIPIPGADHTSPTESQLEEFWEDRFSNSNYQYQYQYQYDFEGEVNRYLPDEYTVSEVAVNDENMTENGVFMSVWAEWEAFGITHNKYTDRLYYRGELIKCFIDNRSGEESQFSGTVSDNLDGTVNILTVRDDSGALVALKEITDKEVEQKAFWR